MKYHPSTQVANKLLELAQQKEGRALTPMQVIKLVYLCHGWMLGLYGRPLIAEHVEAWRYGPVIPELYQAIKKYKSDPVDYPIRNTCPNCAGFDYHENNLIEQVHQKYGMMTGIQLSALTHEEDSPWAITIKNSGLSAIISNDLIEHHFRNRASVSS